MKRVMNTAAEVPGEDEDSYTRSHHFKSIFAEATKGYQVQIIRFICKLD